MKTMAEPSITTAIRSLNTDFSADQTSPQSNKHPAPWSQYYRLRAAY